MAENVYQRKQRAIGKTMNRWLAGLIVAFLMPMSAFADGTITISVFKGGVPFNIQQNDVLEYLSFPNNFFNVDESDSFSPDGLQKILRFTGFPKAPQNQFPNPGDHLADVNLYVLSSESVSEWVVGASPSSGFLSPTLTVVEGGNINITLNLKDDDDNDPVTVWDMPLPNIPGGSEPAWGPSGSVGGVVRLHSGEFTEHVVDLAVPGVGLDMVFGRRYLSNGTLDTLSGNNWDFGHNISVDENDGFQPTITARLGNGREVTFNTVGHLFNSGISGGPGLNDKFPFAADGWPCVFGWSATGDNFLRWEDGTTWIFDNISAGPTTSNPRKPKAIRDRNGNEVLLDYDGTDRLSKVTDTLGREYSIFYYDGQFGLPTTGERWIIREDHGLQRHIFYDYHQDGGFIDVDEDTIDDGNQGELAKVRYYSDVSGTEQRSISYVYATPESAPLVPQGSLLKIIDAEGRVLVENEYNSDGQVIRQEFNDSAVNITYAYHDLDDPFSLGEIGPATTTTIVAYSQTVVRDPEGLVTQYLFDEKKRMIFSRRFTDVAGPGWAYDPNDPNTFNLLDDGVRGANEADSYTTKYAWNDQGDLIETVDSGGVHTVFGYDSDVVFDPRKRGHVTTTDVYDTNGANPIQTVNEYVADNDQASVESIAGLHLVQHEDVLDGTLFRTTYEYDTSANITKVTYPDSTEDQFTYNAKGLVASVVTPNTVTDHGGSQSNSRTDTFTYDFNLPDKAYDVVTVQDSAGGAAITSTDTYDPRGLLVSSVDPNGNETTFSYTFLDMLEKSTLPVAGNGSSAAPSTRYTYDFNNNIDTIAVAHYDVEGSAKLPIVTQYEYDAMDRVERIVNDANGLGATTQFEYDLNGRVVKTLSPEAVAGSQSLNFVETTYDERGFVFETWRAGDDANTKTIFNYDLWGNVSDQVLPDGTTLSFGYDLWGRPESSTNQEDVFTSVDSRNHRGLVLIESVYSDDSPGTLLSTTVNTYDDLGRLTNTKLNGDLVGTTFDYADAGQLWRTTDPAGRENTVTFDSMHRMAESQDGQGNEAAFVYDANSNVISIVQTDEDETGGSPETLTTTFAYDNLNRRISTVDIAQNTVLAKYDSLGRMGWTQDAMGNTNKITFDNLGRKIGAARFASGEQNATATTSQSYDLNGRLTGQTDPKGFETDYQYDAFDRQTMMKYADGSTLEVTDYDDHFLRPRTVRKPDGTVVTNDYDLVGRLSNRDTVAPTGVLATSETFAYDGLGRVTAQGNPVGTDTILTNTTYSYDDFAALPEMTKNVTVGSYSKSVTTQFEHTGLAESKSFNSRTIGYAYNGAGRPSVMTVDGSEVVDMKYVGGRRAAKTVGDEVTANYSYDTADDGYKVAAIVHTDDSSGTTIDDRANEWDDNYNRTSREIRAGPQSLQTTHNYGYDALDRMNTGSSTPVYTLDDAGNRIDTSYSLAGTGEKLHQYASTPSGDFGYDAAGRLSDLTTAGKSYKYDALGRLKELRLTATGAVPSNSQFLAQSTTVSGTWIEENDYIRESSAGAGRLLWTSAPDDLTKFKLQFLRTLDEVAFPDPYGPEHYAQVLLRASQYGPGADEDEWRFLALTIQPDGVFLREWDKDAVVELGGVEVDIPEDVWHDLVVELKGDDVTVKLDLDDATDVETIDATTSIPESGHPGLGVGEAAEFRFKGMGSDKPVAGSVGLRYHYDAAGRVVGRTLDPDGTPVSQFFIYDDDRIMLELSGSGEVITEWVYGVYIDEIIAMYRNTDGQAGYDETYYYIQDDLFNVVALTDDQGIVVERYTYDDYGAPTFYVDNGDGTVTLINDNKSQYGNPFLFNGRRWDERLELYDYRTRYYDPAMGRLLRIDTIGPWGDNNNLGNAYVYVGNNPWSLNDPYGLLSFEDVSLYAQDSGRVAKGFFIKGPVGIVTGVVGAGVTLGDNAIHPIRTSREIVSGVETIFDIATGDESGTGALIAGGVGDYVDRLDRDLETQGEALFNVSTFITGSAYVQSARTAQAANVTRATEQAAIRSRVLANLAESRAGTQSSRFGHFATREAHQLSLARKGASQAIHKNSLDFVGETHVYAIRGPKGTFKIGETTQGVRVRDGQSFRANQQVRALQTQTGEVFESRILRKFDSKRAARDYETRLIERFRRLYGDETLPGNLTNR